ncbi:hypothetical protein M422DRAFT_54449 [Sphaerobolus stellatus SS14]|uniref:Uncharacterized protein n=1 Tax=Sphaerobolus stellatus (strain SS14) TaxID=990650 RepID=A0A0C9UIU0_SPHS4|nr:hypothetical protein M422DRAFT_54449 [Sphaerobolus stellatus SS14]
MEEEHIETENEELNEDFNPADTVGKALAAVKQICSSPQAHAFLCQLCIEEKITLQELKLWIHTRWGSLYNFFTTLLELQPAFDKFCLLADDSDQVPKLRKKRYINFKLLRAEWTMIELMQEVLTEPFSATQLFSNAGRPSLSFGLPTLEYLQYVWENFGQVTEVQTGEGVMHTSFVWLVLDPSSKLAYVEEHWDHR